MKNIYPENLSMLYIVHTRELWSDNMQRIFDPALRLRSDYDRFDVQNYFSPKPESEILIIFHPNQTVSKGI